VDGADDGPFGAHVRKAAQQELTEAACLFDLPEYRLGQLLAQPVGAGVAAQGWVRLQRGVVTVLQPEKLVEVAAEAAELDAS
jgi:hypothetical protein